MRVEIYNFKRLAFLYCLLQWKQTQTLPWIFFFFYFFFYSLPYWDEILKSGGLRIWKGFLPQRNYVMDTRFPGNSENIKCALQIRRPVFYKLKPYNHIGLPSVHGKYCIVVNYVVFEANKNTNKIKFKPIILMKKLRKTLTLCDMMKRFFGFDLQMSVLICDNQVK